MGTERERQSSERLAQAHLEVVGWYQTGEPCPSCTKCTNSLKNERYHRGRGCQDSCLNKAPIQAYIFEAMLGSNSSLIKVEENEEAKVQEMKEYLTSVRQLLSYSV